MTRGGRLDLHGLDRGTWSRLSRYWHGLYIGQITRDIDPTGENETVLLELEDELDALPGDQVLAAPGQ